ncbi:MAG: cell division protein FtsQ [Rhodobacteraceae bacterium HLUCCA12]|nr:MAG: cell division protein FtsQ [Rhodobacteraceae bacterium HLUCCA12]
MPAMSGPYRFDPSHDRASRHHPRPVRPHAFVPPSPLADIAREPIEDSHPAIPSALYSWSDEPGAAHGAARSEQTSRKTRRDPSPSRLAYRLNRLWLTPVIRRGVTVGAPVLILSLSIGLWLGDESRRDQIATFFNDLRTGIENRPEFQVNTLSVDARSDAVAQAVIQRLSLSFPVSSFHLDLPALRRSIEALNAVETAALRIGSDGVLQVSVTEREPAMVWRHRGGLDLVDSEGRSIARLAARDVRADLPLVAGEGAPEAMAEARQLFDAAHPLRDRLRGLVRVSERRWDVVLDRDQRILLPAQGAVAALERVLALDSVQDLLARDVRAVDLRDPSRPTIRLSQTAMSELHRIRNQASGVSDR